MASGWIKLHRQLQECPIWYGERFSKGQAWVDLLMLANHSDKEILFNGEIITVKRGQYLTSTVKLSEKWLWNRKTVMSFLKLLEKDKMISRVSDNKKTLITIENYEIYQSKEDFNGQHGGQHNGQQDNQQSGQQEDSTADNMVDNRTDTNKNDKNVNNVKNEEERKNERMEEKTPIEGASEEQYQSKKAPRKKKEDKIYYPNDEKLNQAFLDFIDMRKKIDKPMTDRAITRAMNKLKNLSALPFSDTMDNDLAIEIIEQSIFHCWQDFYELKQDKQAKTGSSLLDDWRNA